MSEGRAVLHDRVGTVRETVTLTTRCAREAAASSAPSSNCHAQFFVMLMPGEDLAQHRAEGERFKAAVAQLLTARDRADRSKELCCADARPSYS